VLTYLLKPKQTFHKTIKLPFNVAKKYRTDQIISRILKANLNWSPTWAKFRQLIVSFIRCSTSIPDKTQTWAVSTWSSAFSAKEKDTITDRFLCVTRVRVQLEFAFRTWRISFIIGISISFIILFLALILPAGRLVKANTFT